MSIAVACACGKRFKAKDEYAGKRAKCPACGQPLTIPQPPPAKPATDDEIMALAEPEVFQPAARASTTKKPTAAAAVASARVPPLSKSSRPASKGAMPMISISPWVIVLIALAVIVPSLIYWAKEGPLKAEHEWYDRSQKAEYQIPWQVVRGIDQYYINEGMDPNSSGLTYHPKVMMFNFAEPKFMLSLPDKVLFFGSSTDGPFKGSFNPQTWDFEADVTIGGRTHHLVGTADENKRDLTLDGTAVTN